MECGLRDTNSQGNLMLCPFRGEILVQSSLGPVHLQTRRSWTKLQYEAWDSLGGVDPKSTQNVLGGLHTVCGTIAPMCMPCHVGHYFSSKSCQLGQTSDDFSSTALNSTFSSTSKTSQQDGSFLGQCQLAFLKFCDQCAEERDQILSVLRRCYAGIST